MISVLGAEKLSLIEIEAFLSASESVRFVGSSRLELYKWVERLLYEHQYRFRPSHKPWKSIKPIPTFPPPRLRRAKYEKISKRSLPKLPNLHRPFRLIPGLEKTVFCLRGQPDRKAFECLQSHSFPSR